MIVFLVVTSIINLGLGYALAVYLRVGSTQSTREEADDLTRSTHAATPSTPFQQSGASWTQRATTLAGVRGPQPTEPAPSLASTSIVSAAQEAERGEPLTLTNGMEQELLAGIEEFRNQLAQLKSQSFDDPMSSPFTAEPVGAR